MRKPVLVPGTLARNNTSRTQGVPETHLCLVMIILSNLRKITRTFRNPQAWGMAAWHLDFIRQNERV